MSSALDRLKQLTTKLSGYEVARKQNLARLEELFKEVGVNKKVHSFSELFTYKAINLSGVSLVSETLGEIRSGKYLQILGILYDKDATIKSKNVSLGYFGRVESVDEKLKDTIVEFVIRYRFEKSFMTLENYYEMLGSFSSEDA